MLLIRSTKTLIAIAIAIYGLVNIALYALRTDATQIINTIHDTTNKIAHNGLFKSVYKQKWDRYVVALKTSSDTAAARVPIQMLTFLRHLPNVYFFGDSYEELGDTRVYDVVNTLYKDGNLSVLDINGKVMKAANGVSNGWIMDAHKNLPGFRRLYELYPNRDWYVMIDDDTYMFFENLDASLKNIDPSQPHYFGAYYTFTGCDNVFKQGDGPDFAHGGSGIVVSRGAMLRMMKVMEECIESYRTCWAGDVRTALCLRDANVTLDRRFNGRFINAEPDENLFWPDDACKTPITFHHLKAKKIYELYAAENTANREGRETNYADIFKTTMASHPEQILDKTDVGGYPFAQERTTDKERCKDVCRENIKCRSYVYDENGICWLKGSIQKSNTVTQSRSAGFITTNYVCTPDRRPLEKTNIKK